MDLQITKDEDIYLSDYNCMVNDIDFTSASLEIDQRTVLGRSGYIHAGSRYSDKNISVVGKLKVEDIEEYHRTKDFLNMVLVDKKPYYITRMYPYKQNLYEYENPGEVSGEINYNDNVLANYRFKVLCQNGIETNFLGKSNAGLLFSFSIDFITAELPFGESLPVDLNVTGGKFLYKGTVENSQLEYNWALRLTSSKNQATSFSVIIDERKFIYKSDTPILLNDIFEISATGTKKNGETVSGNTNYEYFTIQSKGEKPTNVITDFKGKIEIVNYVELYK